MNRHFPALILAFLFTASLAPATPAGAATVVRIMPPDRATFAVGQRVDFRVEATSDTGPGSAPPLGLRVFIDDEEITDRNVLDPGVGGERGAGGTGATAASLAPRDRAGAAPAHSSNFLLRDHVFARPGIYRLHARTADGAHASVRVQVIDWQGAPEGRPGVRNVIFFLGDGMGIAHRTAARIVSRGVTGGRANGRLAMDRLEVTGQVMTSALNAVISDSAPGMAAYVTGNKANNNQQGVFPDNTSDEAFDNPRVEYIGAMLRRLRGPGFGVGIVTTADVTDATPAANAVHTANRYASAASPRASSTSATETACASSWAAAPATSVRKRRCVAAGGMAGTSSTSTPRPASPT
jgi:alkaline phosphatase